jgi:hypothetical protein
MKVATDSSGAVVRQPIARLGSGAPFHRQRKRAFALLLDALRYQLKHHQLEVEDIRAFVSEVARINRMTTPGRSRYFVGARQFGHFRTGADIGPDLERTLGRIL